MTSERTDQDIIRLQLPYSVAHAVEKLEQLLRAHDITIFARIDFSGDAERAGLALRPEQMLIFGNPRAGTSLMQAEPVAGLDLPLKALLWEDVQGMTWVACNSPDYIVRRHGLPAAMAANLAGAIAILRQFAE
jgi:uncharacterized protein (DUF302 family)